MLPLDTSVQAEYEDGFILDETELQDVSPYNGGQNVLRAILDKTPEAEHGKMVRFSGFYKNKRYDIDWTKVPESGRPIRFRHGFLTIGQSGVVEKGWSGMDFGYQYNDDSGRNVEVKEEVR